MKTKNWITHNRHSAMTQYKHLITVTGKLVKQFTRTTNAHERKAKHNTHCTLHAVCSQ